MYFSKGPIAQWIEHPPSKRVVAGSSPARSEFMKQYIKNRSLIVSACNPRRTASARASSDFQPKSSDSLMGTLHRSLPKESYPVSVRSLII